MNIDMGCATGPLIVGMRIWHMGGPARMHINNLGGDTAWLQQVSWGIIMCKHNLVYVFNWRYCHADLHVILLKQEVWRSNKLCCHFNCAI